MVSVVKKAIHCIIKCTYQTNGVLYGISRVLAVVKLLLDYNVQTSIVGIVYMMR